MIHARRAPTTCTCTCTYMYMHVCTYMYVCASIKVIHVCGSLIYMHTEKTTILLLRLIPISSSPTTPLCIFNALDHFCWHIMLNGQQILKSFWDVHWWSHSSSRNSANTVFITSDAMAIIMQFCVASIQEWLLFKSGVYLAHCHACHCIWYLAR